MPAPILHFEYSLFSKLSKPAAGVLARGSSFIAGQIAELSFGKGCRITTGIGGHIAAFNNPSKQLANGSSSLRCGASPLHRLGDLAGAIIVGLWPGGTKTATAPATTTCGTALGRAHIFRFAPELGHCPINSALRICANDRQGTVRIARLPCRDPRKPRISKPVRELSGESRLT